MVCRNLEGVRNSWPASLVIHTAVLLLTLRVLCQTLPAEGRSRHFCGCRVPIVHRRLERRLQQCISNAARSQPARALGFTMSSSSRLSPATLGRGRAAAAASPRSAAQDAAAGDLTRPAEPTPLGFSMRLCSSDLGALSERNVVVRIRPRAHAAVRECAVLQVECFCRVLRVGFCSSSGVGRVHLEAWASATAAAGP